MFEDLIGIVSPEVYQKITELESVLVEMQSVVVAYSGGVDSGLLSLVAHRVLGEKMLAVTIESPLESHGETEKALQCARSSGFPVRLVKVDDLQNPDVVKNPPDRCYFCKHHRFTLLEQLRIFEGYKYSAEGSNADDESQYRPGRKAIQELGIRSPLAEVGLTKSEIRILAKALGLNSWQKPSAPCLATRFPYNSPITADGLRRIDEAERYLSGLGFTSIRVRLDGDTSRIEVHPDQIGKLVEQRADLVNEFKALGIKYVTLDLEGYRSGSMDEVLSL